MRAAPTPETVAAIEEAAERYRNWGKWGDDDQLGTLNYIDAEKIKQAATLVRRASPDDEPWTAARLEEALAPFWEEHGTLRTDPAARSPKNTLLDPGPERWRVRQILPDPEEHNDWYLDLTIDLAASRDEGQPVLELRHIGT